MKPCILITGQIRDQQVFNASLNQFHKLKEEGFVDHIYFSTWLGQVNDPELRQNLKAVGVVLVESPEPKEFSVGGHPFHQLKAARLVLDRLPGTQRVLKTRADVIFEDVKDLRQLLTCDLSIDLLKPFSSPFLNRVWSPFIDVSLPFLISDIVLAGCASDLRTIFTADISPELFFGKYLSDGSEQYGALHHPGPEFRFFIPAFAQEFTILRTLLSVYTYHVHDPDIRQFNVTSEWYWCYLSLYYFIVLTYFRIGRDVVKGRVFCISHLDRKTEDPAAPTAVLPRSTIDPDAFLSNWLVRPTGHLYCDSSEWLNKLFAGAIDDDKINQLLYKSLSRAFMYRDSANVEFEQYRAELTRFLVDRHPRKTA